MELLARIDMKRVRIARPFDRIVSGRHREAKLPSLPLIVVDRVLPLAKSDIDTLMPATLVGWDIGTEGEIVPGPESTRPKTTAVGCAAAWEAWSDKPHFLDTSQITASTMVQPNARLRCRSVVNPAGEAARIECFKSSASSCAKARTK